MLQIIAEVIRAEASFPDGDGEQADKATFCAQAGHKHVDFFKSGTQVG